MTQRLTLSPEKMIQPRRKITGMSAVLLPFAPDGSIDWTAFQNHLLRTAEAGLTPAVNMDTSYVNLLDNATRKEVLVRTRKLLGSQRFVAGAYVGDQEGSPFDVDAYASQIDLIQDAGGTPVIFQSFGLTQQDDQQIVDSYHRIAKHCDRFIGFELGTMFAPFGRIYSLELYEQLMKIPKCIGAKHSSLRRDLEWERLALRNAVRPDFKVFTGNDLAIDMVIYGSDYLLGLSCLAPDLFAQRDAMWESGDPAFYQLNDVLQYLGCFVFRDPVPAYKHSAAIFLHERGWLGSDLTHPDSPTRPATDRETLRKIITQLGLNVDK